MAGETEHCRLTEGDGWSIKPSLSSSEMLSDNSYSSIELHNLLASWCQITCCMSWLCPVCPLFESCLFISAHILTYFNFTPIPRLLFKDSYWYSILFIFFCIAFNAVSHILCESTFWHFSSINEYKWMNYVVWRGDLWSRPRYRTPHGGVSLRGATRRQHPVLRRTVLVQVATTQRTRVL